MPKTVLTQEDLKHVAKLANLALTPEELATYTPQLEKVFEYFQVLNTVNTDNVQPTYQLTGLKNQLRPDVVVPSMDTKFALSSSSHTDGSYILAPKTIHKE